MNKRKSVIIIISIITIIFIVIVATLYIFINEKPFPNHEFSIDYDYQTSSEREAINVTESLNYEDILMIPRYNQTEAGYPNFIDKTVINDYIDIYNNTDENYDKWFKYRAKATQIENSTLRYFVEYEAVNISWKDPETDEWRYDIRYEPRYKIEVNAGDETVYRYNDEIFEPFDPIIARNFYGNFEFLNNSQNFTIFYSDAFIIEMSLKYGYTAGCCNGCYMGCNQIVILDLSYNPTCIMQIYRRCAVA